MSKGTKMRMEMSDPENPNAAAARSWSIPDAHTAHDDHDGQKKYHHDPREHDEHEWCKGATTANTPTFTFNQDRAHETVAGVSCDVIQGRHEQTGRPKRATSALRKGRRLQPGNVCEYGRPEPCPRSLQHPRMRSVLATAC